MRPGTLVKYSNPVNEDESKLIFKVVNYNEETKRALCECQNLKGWETGLKPVMLLGIEHIEQI